MDYKKIISEKIKIEGVSSEEIAGMIILPPDTTYGDYALPCFKFSKILRKSPVEICNMLAPTVELDDNIVKVNAVNGYLNFVINRKNRTEQILNEIDSGKYGASNVGLGKTVCIDYSSINIAKPFHIGHLSTTVIGGALYKIYKYLGYNVVGINHLGDYGTQFGKLIFAYKHWGNKEDVQNGGIRELSRLYVKYHEEVETHPEYDDEARSYFKLIENNDKECNELFNWFKELTLKDVNKIYEKLDIKFDSYAGESFYNDKMQPIIDELERKGLLEVSDGAKIVNLEKFNMPPCLILRSDGASLYATRDLAAAVYRKNTYDFAKCLYVVAYQQDLHFKQFFKVLELMGYEWAKNLEHVAFGMVSLEDGTMSTRKGKVVLLDDVINRCNEKALEIVTNKNPNLEDKEKVAEMVGTGAVIFSVLTNARIKDIVFSYDRVLSFEGETGPYVQYTVARINSLLSKGGEIGSYDYSTYTEDEYNIISQLEKFPSILQDSINKNEPCYVARFALELASYFNKFYFNCKVVGEEDNVKNFRLRLAKATKEILTTSMGLLGIKCPEKM